MFLIFSVFTFLNYHIKVIDIIFSKSALVILIVFEMQNQKSSISLYNESLWSFYIMVFKSKFNQFFLPEAAVTLIQVSNTSSLMANDRSKHLLGWRKASHQCFCFLFQIDFHAVPSICASTTSSQLDTSDASKMLNEAFIDNVDT